MSEEKNSKATLYISLATLILGILGFLFGDNVKEQLSGPQLNLNSTKLNMNLPSKFDEIINDYSNKNDVPNLPDSYRVISIENQGSSPSKNLRLVINLDGEIYDYKVNSTEKIKEHKINKNELVVETERLSTNAQILLEVWLKNTNNKFQINYADDRDSKQLKQDKPQTGNNLFENIMIILSLISMAIFVYSKIKLSSGEKFREINFKNQELEIQYKTMLENLKEESDNELKEKVEEDEKADDVYNRLEAFIKNSRKNL
ncbi:hypothetical protein ACFX4I_26125 [Peribacillus sp. YIM B13472]|uniref:hypothetical protein n=1 Tax=Peribacillus sp. YIM B13472 TaxID=3366297 RepID=UPI00366D900A